MKRIALLLLAMAMLTAACGDDVLEDGSTSTASTEASSTTGGEASSTLPPTTTEAAPPPSSTLPPTTTTTLPPTTTTTAAPTTTAVDVTYEIDEMDFFPDPLPGSAGAHGSGCVVPGGSMTLTDGIWFGFANTLSGGEIGFDLACFFTGPIGWEKAEEDGEIGYDLDFYIRNNNPTIRQVPLAPDARVFYVDGATIAMVETTPAGWPTAASFLPCTGQYCSVWLYVNDGEVTGLVEQYLP